MTKKIVLTPQELIQKLATDLEEILNLRNETHYDKGRPDERYENPEDIPDGAWSTWADRVYNRNNRIGTPLADAQKIVMALIRYINQIEEGTD